MSVTDHFPAPSSIRMNGAFVRVLLDWLDLHHLDAPALRASVMRYGPADAVPILQWPALLERAVALRPGPGRGLEIGACVGFQHVGVLGYLVLASDNLGQAIYAYQRFEALFYGVKLARVTLGAHYAEIGWPITGMASLGLLVDETAISALLNFLRRTAPDAPSPLEVCFPSPAPTDPAPYERFFGCPVHFDAPYLRVRFPAEYLERPLPTADPTLRQLLDRQGEALSSALPGGDPFAFQVQRMILRLLPDARVSLAEIAAAMAVSVRTLQRRLAGVGLSFQPLLDRTRQELAQTYLRDPSLGLSEITLLLGFAEQSSFNRAFRQWTGQTPGRWRREHRRR